MYELRLFVRCDDPGHRGYDHDVPITRGSAIDVLGYPEDILAAKRQLTDKGWKFDGDTCICPDCLQRSQEKP